MNYDSTVTERDERLGALLNELEVPGHGPGFDAELRARLRREHRRTKRRFACIDRADTPAVAAP